jgi:hypothetical protein
LTQLRLFLSSTVISDREHSSELMSGLHKNTDRMTVSSNEKFQITLPTTEELKFMFWLLTSLKFKRTDPKLVWKIFWLL